MPKRAVRHMSHLQHIYYFEGKLGHCCDLPHCSCAGFGVCDRVAFIQPTAGRSLTRARLTSKAIHVRMMMLLPDLVTSDDELP